MDLCRQSHATPSESRPEIIRRFSDQRLKRLARRLIYFESPHLFEEVERRVIADDIAARRRGEGNHALPPWTTIAQAQSELETIERDVSDEFKKSFFGLL